MKTIQKFWVPWSKKTGYMCAYCNYSKKKVILDLSANYIGLSFNTSDKELKSKGIKIVRVTFKKVLQKKSKK